MECDSRKYRVTSETVGEEKLLSCYETVITVGRWSLMQLDKYLKTSMGHVPRVTHLRNTGAVVSAH